MIKILSNRFQIWLIALLGGAWAVLGMYCDAAQRRVAGLSSQSWFMLSVLAYIEMVMCLAAQILVKMEKRGQ